MDPVQVCVTVVVLVWEPVSLPVAVLLAVKDGVAVIVPVGENVAVPV